jgi:mRNA interferase YafQ
MKEILTTNRFEKDQNKAYKQGKNIALMKKAMLLIALGEERPSSFREHKLKGKYLGRKERHISPDWLLIYQIKGVSVVFERTGSHAELFG